MTILFDRWNTQVRTIPLRADSTIAVGTVLTNLMNTSETVVVQSGGVTGKQISVSLGEHESKVDVPGTPAGCTPPTHNITTIRIRYNVGFGNRTTLRVDTDPFQRSQALGTRTTTADVCGYQLRRIPAGHTFQFKPLVNDVNWTLGLNYTGTGGSTMDIYPTIWV